MDGDVRSFFSYVDFRGFALVDMQPRLAVPWRLASPAHITCRPYASRAGDSREELCDASCRP
jgi:hypothetical protein